MDSINHSPVNAATHPTYVEHSVDWQIVRDCYAGERRIKDLGLLYLPATDSMYLDGMANALSFGYKRYEAYKQRAIFHDYVRESVEHMVGMIHNKPPQIQLPPEMEGLRENCTVYGESMEMLLRNINIEQLITGRCGLLADLPNATTLGNTLPYISLYTAESIVNWDSDKFNLDDNLNLVVLNESGYSRMAGYSWTFVSKYRILHLGNITDTEDVAYGANTYSQEITSVGLEFAFSDTITPKYLGKSLNFIPFQFINSTNITSDIDKPPLLGLANLAIAIYRGEADYRQNQYMQGQDTLVIIGATSEDETDVLNGEGHVTRTGANSKIEVPLGGDVKYVGVTGKGLTEQRLCLENDKQKAAVKAGQLITNQKSNLESGSAMRIRIASQTASIRQISISSAYGLQAILRNIATWMNLDPELVIVEPNLEFQNLEMDGQQLNYIQTAKQMNAPLSDESMHGVLRDSGLTEFTYEEELARITKEKLLHAKLDAQVNAIVNPPVANPGAVPPTSKPNQKLNPNSIPSGKGIDNKAKSTNNL